MQAVIVPMEGMMSVPGRIRRSAPRGVAMLLVLIALACATIMATAYLASRDNSGPIGANAVAATEARWASLSGLELAVAVMETESVWRTAHVDGRLLENHAIGNATIDIDVIDLMTELAPTDATEMVQITATARVGEVMQQSSATAIITPGAGGRIDVDLAEFAMYANSRIMLNDAAAVARWDDAPSAKLGRRVALGCNGTAAGVIDVCDRSEVIDGTMWLHESASASAYRAATDQGAKIGPIPDSLPMPEPPTPPAPSGPGTLTHTVTVETTLGATRQVNDLNVVTSAGVLRIEDGVTLSVLNNLVMMVDGTIVIEGDVTIVVDGDASLSESAIVLAPGAALTLFVGGDLTLTQSYLGDDVEDDERWDVDGAASFVDVAAIRVYGQPRHAGTWTFEKGSVVKAQLYAPRNDVMLTGDSAVYGRIAANRIGLYDASAVYVDQGLDGGFGYTNPESAVWDGDAVAAPVANLASLDASDLEALADALLVEVGLGDLLFAPSGGVVLISSASEGSVTARTVEVEYAIKSVGEPPKVAESLAVSTERIRRGAVETKAQSAIAADLDSFAAKMRALEVDMFVAVGGRSAAQVQEIMATSLDTAATKVREGDASMALFKLRSVLSRFDGDSSAPDVMESCTTKKRICSAISEQIEVIMKYVSDD